MAETETKSVGSARFCGSGKSKLEQAMEFCCSKQNRRYKNLAAAVCRFSPPSN